MNMLNIIPYNIQMLTLSCVTFAFPQRTILCKYNLTEPLPLLQNLCLNYCPSLLAYGFDGHCVVCKCLFYPQTHRIQKTSLVLDQMLTVQSEKTSLINPALIHVCVYVKCKCVCVHQCIKICPWQSVLSNDACISLIFCALIQSVPETNS